MAKFDKAYFEQSVKNVAAVREDAKSLLVRSSLHEATFHLEAMIGERISTKSGEPIGTKAEMDKPHVFAAAAKVYGLAHDLQAALTELYGTIGIRPS